MPIATPRYFLPSVVITISVPSKTGTASECLCSFTITHVLKAFGSIRSRDLSLRVGPTMSSRQIESFPPAAASSAYQICFTSSSLRRLMSGVMAMAYMAMASGSPCVVPSWEKMVSPSM